MKNKILLILLLIVGIISLTACTNKKVSLTDAEKFKKEYESFNGKKNDYFEYRDLSINEKNPFVYTTAEDIVKKIENKETFIVYFGDPECPWCRSIIEQAVKSAIENSIDKIYYVRIWNGFHNEILRDVYELKDGNPTIKTKGTEAYYKLLKYFDKLLGDYTLTDESKNSVSVNEKRIFAPNFIYVKNGKAEELIEGISQKQESFNSELTEEVTKEEKKIFDNFYTNTILCSDKC